VQVWRARKDAADVRDHQAGPERGGAAQPGGTCGGLSEDVSAVMVSLECAIERYERLNGVRPMLVVGAFENAIRLATSAVDGSIGAAGMGVRR
jgi:hypothetical protein